jgi:MFS family permease
MSDTPERNVAGAATGPPGPPPARSESPPLDRTAYAFLGTTCLSVVGTAFGLLGATGATTAAGGTARGGLYTGAFMAACLLATALATPYGHSVYARWGVRAGFTTVQASNALAYLIAGVALLAGAPTMPTLLIAAPVFGATAGMSIVVRPLVSKAYQASNNTAHSFARLSVALGIAWGLGGLLGGWALSTAAFGWGLIIDALLTVPMLIVLTRVLPTREPAPPTRTRHPLRSTWRRLSASRHLRWTAVLGVSSVIFLAPIMGLVVPVADDLRQEPAVAAAGLLLAAFAIGEIATPWAVRFAQRTSTELRAGQIAGTLGGVMLAALGVASSLLNGRVELVAWAVLAVPLGVFRFAARALYVGSAADADPPEDAAADLAAADTAVLLMAPLGALVFGATVNHGAVYLALYGTGACAIVWNLFSIRASRTSDPHRAQAQVIERHG